MGLLDSIKSGTKNAINRTEEEMGTMKLRNSISNLKDDNERRYAEIGKKYFQNHKDPYPEFKSEMDVACKAISDNLKKIEDLEKEMEEYRQAHRDEREANRQAAAAADEKKE